MQGKEASEQETVKYSAGIDVGKNWLDAHIVPVDISLRVANSREGIRKLKRWLMRIKPDLVAVEATGKWHRPLCRSLHAGGIAVAIADPFRVRMFAKAQGVLAKTDRVDAAVLARFAAVMTPEVRSPASLTIEELQELITARDRAVAEQTSLKNQRSAAECSFLKRQFERRIARLRTDIAAIENECLTRIKSDPVLLRRHAILCSLPGIGERIAAILVASMRELGGLNAKQAASLAGLAPIANDSGQHTGARRVRGGRPMIRKMLYLAALSASRHNPALLLFYRRLTQSKPPKVALVAVARKLLLLANTLIAEDRLWQPTPP